MAKFTWQDGTLVSKAKVEIGGVIYEVDPDEYSGTTPLSAANLNAMQDGIYQDIGNLSNLKTPNKSDLVNAVNSVVETTLYQGTTQSDNIQLSENPIGKYKSLKISYIYNGLYTKTIEINLEDKQEFTIRDNYVINNALISAFAGFQVNGQTISKIGGQCGYIEDTTIHIDQNNYFTITEVLGCN
jgi:hypothetical protein